MKNILKLLLALASIFAIYCMIIVSISNEYLKEATHHNQLGALAYRFGNKIEGNKEGVLARQYKQKSVEIMDWLPSFAKLR